MTSLLYPVIHHRDMATTMRNASIAFRARCAGVFLIEMTGLDSALDPAVIALRDKYPNFFFVGVNRLATHPIEAVRRDMELGATGSWADQCGITSSGTSALGRDLAREISIHQQAMPTYLFFGSVAFKGQAPDPDPATAALRAVEAGFIATTSGAATGRAPDVSKIASIATKVSSARLALASGVTPENVRIFLPYVGHFLVATGISKTFHEFDEAKVNQLAENIAAFSAA